MPRLVKIKGALVNLDTLNVANVGTGGSLSRPVLWLMYHGECQAIGYDTVEEAEAALDELMAAVETPRPEAAETTERLYSACRLAVEYIDAGIGRRIDVLHELNKSLNAADKREAHACPD